VLFLQPWCFRKSDVVQTYPLASHWNGGQTRPECLRPHEPGKDGKDHVYWSLVETARRRAGFESLFDARGQQITYTDAGDAR
jgi:hypothetical protein